MTTHPRHARLDADTFLEWSMAQPTGRYELAGGEVVKMASERISHTRSKARAWALLDTAIVAAGLGCEAIADGVSVRIDDNTVYEPDALVRCGPPAPGEDLWIDDPIIVVEVVSPSSGGVDTGIKLADYFRLPTVRHYLIVQTEARAVIHHHRDDAGEITTRILRDGALTLDPPGLSIPVTDIFGAP